MRSIHIQGDQFRIGTEIRPYVFRSSFCLLGHYQQGNRDKGLRWLDRIQAQGFDGPRVFGENEDWFLQGGPPPAFFGNPAWTTEAVAFPDHHQGPFSKLTLIPGYEELVVQLSQDLIARELVGEFCCIATIKGRDPAWISHGLNKFAQMFARLFPNPQESPWLFETVNEGDAHSDLDQAEASRLGGRWRRSSASDPTHHNYPGSTIGMSSGGDFAPWFPDHGMTHRDFHPPRGPDWAGGVRLPDGTREEIMKTCARLRRDSSGRPVAFNETIHYLSQQEWDFFIGESGISKWVGLSTTDHEAIVQYVDAVRRSGVSICVHDRIGMSTDPDVPLSPLELEITDYLGGVSPMPPVPPGPKKLYFTRVIEQAYQEVLGRAPDPPGLEHYNELMRQGLTEAQLRESMIRSAEFTEKNTH